MEIKDLFIEKPFFRRNEKKTLTVIKNINAVKILTGESEKEKSNEKLFSFTLPEFINYLEKTGKVKKSSFLKKEFELLNKKYFGTSFDIFKEGEKYVLKSELTEIEFIIGKQGFSFKENIEKGEYNEAYELYNYEDSTEFYIQSCSVNYKQTDKGYEFATYMAQKVSKKTGNLVISSEGSYYSNDQKYQIAADLITEIKDNKRKINYTLTIGNEEIMVSKGVYEDFKKDIELAIAENNVNFINEKAEHFKQNLKHSKELPETTKTMGDIYYYLLDKNVISNSDKHKTAYEKQFERLSKKYGKKLYEIKADNNTYKFESEENTITFDVLEDGFIISDLGSSKDFENISEIFKIEINDEGYVESWIKVNLSGDISFKTEFINDVTYGLKGTEYKEETAKMGYFKNNEEVITFSRIKDFKANILEDSNYYMELSTEKVAIDSSEYNKFFTPFTKAIKGNSSDFNSLDLNAYIYMISGKSK